MSPLRLDMAAEQAGFRACKRCRPDETDRQAVAAAQACRMIEQAETPLKAWKPRRLENYINARHVMEKRWRHGRNIS